MRAGALLGAFLITAWAASAAAEPPSLVADLNLQTINGSALPAPYDFIGPQRAELGGVLYFAATDLQHGQELWRSDGSPGGTRLVRDIRPGSAGSGLLAMTVHRGRLYFFADDGVWGLELWSSDGTREGTRLVRDVCPGPCPAALYGAIASAGDRLYFTAGRFGDFELWRTDGTREGTRRVAAPCSACFSFLGNPLLPLPDGRVFFVLHHPQSGRELWVSDGTPEGTRVLDLAPGRPGSDPTGLTALGNRLLFWADDGAVSSLWISDGTPAGTRIVRRDFLPPGYDSGPVAWQGSAYFANDAAELWRTDGTPGGTVRLKAFETGPVPVLTRPVRLTPLADRLLFVAGDSRRGTALWQTRGTPQTTRLVKDPAPGPDVLVLAGLHRAGDRAFFLTWSLEKRLDLWVSDGRIPGTRRVSTLCDGGECSAPDLRDFASAGRVAFLTVHSTLVGSELWRSDGTAAGTFLVRDIHNGPRSAGVTEIAALNGRALFPALTTESSRAALWSSDGTTAGTSLVRDDAPWPQDFVHRDGRLYFSGAGPWYAGDPLYLRRQGLWRTDGTPAGTELLAGDLFDLDLLALEGGALFLSARDHEATDLGTGIEPWKSDGTPEGTLQVVDLNQQWVANAVTSPPLLEPASSDPGPPVRLGPVLLFAADDGLSGRELWATDGTATGTRKVRDINRQDREDGWYLLPGTSDPGSLVRLGDVVLFAADDGLSGRELWVTDGTEAGTRRLRDLRPGTEGSRPHNLVELGGMVYFFASAASAEAQGEALWRTDGTEGGTVQIKSLARRGLPSRGRELLPAGGRLFFVADNEAIGPELHVSDGTAAGTRLVQIRPGPNGAYPQSLTAVDGLLVFAADDGAHGLEPWRSDGTAAGTYPLGDLAPGQAASAPSAFTAAGALLFFAADDGVHGRELWVAGWPR
jgi:large repetitive protein